MSRRRFRAWFVIPCAALSLALAGCGGASGSASTATPKQSPVSVDVAPVQAATSITDVRGQRISVARKPERVVCLVALCDDMLLELGMRPVATSSTILEHPGFLGKDAAQVPKIPGGFLSPDAEAIVKAEPDLVIGLAQTHEQLAANLKGIAPLWLLAPGPGRSRSGTCATSPRSPTGASRPWPRRSGSARSWPRPRRGRPRTGPRWSSTAATRTSRSTAPARSWVGCSRGWPGTRGRTAAPAATRRVALRTRWRRSSPATRT